MSSSANLSNLLGSAGLDANATSAMELTADTLGPAIMAGLGDVSLDDITTSEVVLVRLLLDDSSSIQSITGGTEAIRKGGNKLVEALQGSKQSAEVLIGYDQLNRGVLYAYRPLAGAPKLDGHNYNPSGGTPLYEQTAVMLTSVAAKVAEFEQGGVAVRAISVIVTDGADSTNDMPDNVLAIASGLLKTEQHIIAAVGIDDAVKDPQGNIIYPGTDFRAVFRSMGVPERWILTPDNDLSSIREAFAVISQSAVRASQSAGSFSQTAAGGFGP